MQNHITAIGEILFDIYGTKKVLGGAPFNFIYHIFKFGISSGFITAIGDDQDGQDIKFFLANNEFPREHLKIIPGKQTGKVLVKLNKEKIPEYHIKNDVAYDYIGLSSEERKKILAKKGILYFGTLCQRENTSRNSIQELLNQNEINFCDLNLRHSFYSKEIIEHSLKRTKILKLSFDELRVVEKLCFNESFELKHAVKKLQCEYGVAVVAVTHGENGAELFSKDDHVISKPEKIDVVDTLGSGDAYSAILAIGILKNVELDKINRLAVSFAGDICRINGALPPSQEIYARYSELLIND